MRDYHHPRPISEIPPSPFNAQLSSNFITHSNFGINLVGKNFLLALSIILHISLPLFGKQVQILNNLRMKGWANVGKDTHVPSYEDINEIKNFDVYSSKEGYLYSSLCASSFFDFSMVRQDQKSSKVVLKEYIKLQVNMMSETKTIIIELEKDNVNSKESIYQTTQVLDQFEPNTNMLNDMVDDNKETIHLDVPLTENSDELDVTNLLTITLDFKSENFDGIVHECINNEFTNSEGGDNHQTHLQHIENTP